MADNFVDPFDMDMTDIFDDLHGFGDFPAVKPDVGAYAPYEREMPPKLHVKAEPVYPTPAPVPYDPNTEPIPRSNGMSSDEVEHQKQLRRRAQIGKLEEYSICVCWSLDSMRDLVGIECCWTNLCGVYWCCWKVFIGYLVLDI